MKAESPHLPPAAADGSASAVFFAVNWQHIHASHKNIRNKERGFFDARCITQQQQQSHGDLLYI